jgi:hypothetical protein
MASFYQDAGKTVVITTPAATGTAVTLTGAQTLTVPLTAPTLNTPTNILSTVDSTCTVADQIYNIGSSAITATPGTAATAGVVTAPALTAGDNILAGTLVEVGDGNQLVEYRRSYSVPVAQVTPTIAFTSTQLISSVQMVTLSPDTVMTMAQRDGTSTIDVRKYAVTDGTIGGEVVVGTFTATQYAMCAVGVGRALILSSDGATNYTASIATTSAIVAGTAVGTASSYGICAICMLNDTQGICVWYDTTFVIQPIQVYGTTVTKVGPSTTSTLAASTMAEVIGVSGSTFAINNGTHVVVGTMDSVYAVTVSAPQAIGNLSQLSSICSLGLAGGLPAIAVVLVNSVDTYTYTGWGTISGTTLTWSGGTPFQVVVSTDTLWRCHSTGLSTTTWATAYVVDVAATKYTRVNIWKISGTTSTYVYSATAQPSGLTSNVTSFSWRGVAIAKSGSDNEVVVFSRTATKYGYLFKKLYTPAGSYLSMYQQSMATAPTALTNSVRIDDTRILVYKAGSQYVVTGGADGAISISSVTTLTGETASPVACVVAGDRILQLGSHSGTFYLKECGVVGNGSALLTSTTTTLTANCTCCWAGLNRVAIVTWNGASLTCSYAMFTYDSGYQTVSAGSAIVVANSYASMIGAIKIDTLIVTATVTASGTVQIGAWGVGVTYGPWTVGTSVNAGRMIGGRDGIVHILTNTTANVIQILSVKVSDGTLLATNVVDTVHDYTSAVLAVGGLSDEQFVVGYNGTGGAVQFRMRICTTGYDAATSTVQVGVGPLSTITATCTGASIASFDGKYFVATLPATLYLYARQDDEAVVGFATTSVNAGSTAKVTGDGEAVDGTTDVIMRVNGKGKRLVPAISTTVYGEYGASGMLASMACATSTHVVKLRSDGIRTGRPART